MEIALNRSFFFPSNEPYGGIAGFYDYGPTGVLMKKKIETLWVRRFIKQLGYYEMQSAIITPEPVLKASGHVDHFTDPIATCKQCSGKFRADHLAEEQVEGFKWDGSLESLERIFREKEIKCPSCGSRLEELGVFNLMFKTAIGADKIIAYTRPETAQGIFTAFLRLWRNHGGKLPLVVGQVGRSFRNEISPRNVLVRMREFTQMELEFFFNPSNTTMPGFEEVKDVSIRFWSAEGQEKGEEPKMIPVQELVETEQLSEIFAYFLAKEWLFYDEIGIDLELCRFRELLSTERPHYSNGNVDMEVLTSYGWIETIGNADRSNYDLSQHQKMSGKKFEVFDAATGERLVPHVFEVSMGVDRLIFALLEHNLKKNEFGEVFTFKPIIAPYDLAVLPLMRRDGLEYEAKQLARELSIELDVLYMESGSIGKRFWRSDSIGVPYAVIIDYQTQIDGTVSFRFRDSGKQIRVKKGEVEEKIKKYRRKGITDLPEAQ